MPSERFHPASYVLDDMIELDMKPSDLAEKLGLDLLTTKKFLHEWIEVDDDIATRLANWLGTSKEMWLGLQGIYNSK